MGALSRLSIACVIETNAYGVYRHPAVMYMDYKDEDHVVQPSPGSCSLTLPPSLSLSLSESEACQERGR